MGSAIWERVKIQIFLAMNLNDQIHLLNKFPFLKKIESYIIH